MRARPIERRRLRIFCKPGEPDQVEAKVEALTSCQQTEVSMLCVVVLWGPELPHTFSYQDPVAIKDMRPGSHKSTGSRIPYRNGIRVHLFLPGSVHTAINKYGWVITS
eukprot:364142-Prorocentrum_minimum.AAC.1